MKISLLCFVVQDHHRARGFRGPDSPAGAGGSRVLDPSSNTRRLQGSGPPARAPGVWHPASSGWGSKELDPPVRAGGFRGPAPSWDWGIMGLDTPDGAGGLQNSGPPSQGHGIHKIDVDITLSRLLVVMH